MDIQKVNEKLSVETIDKPSFSDKGVLERIEKKIMPPPFAAFQPTDQEREEISYKGVEGIEKMKRNEIE